MTVTNADDGRKDVWEDNKRVGFVIDTFLYGIDKDGFALLIGEVGDISEALEAIKKWRNQQA